MSFFRKSMFVGLSMLTLCLVSWSLLEVIAESQQAAQSEVVANMVHQGAELERSRQWIDAIDHYREALKSWPDHPELKYGLRRSKFHLQIDRRYGDPSFRQQILTLSEYEAYSLLDELMGRIRSHYVDQVSQTYFIAHGTESVYLSLNNEAFLKQHQLDHLSGAKLKRVRRMLFENYWNKPVTGTFGPRDLVAEVAGKLEAELGVQPIVVISEYIFGGCNALDDYSSFLTPGKLSDLYSNIEGEFVGLGIELKSEPGKGVFLVDVMPESPAEEGGLQPGDYIKSIDGHDCRDLPTGESADLLTGRSGSQVYLQWATSQGERKEGYFTRREVKVKSIPFVKIVDPAQGIGYLRMANFQKSSAEEFDAALLELRRHGMKSLIWDLRGNPGGLLTAAVEVLDRVIERGVLVTTKGRTRDQNWQYVAHSLGTWDLPLVLLVDENSASASEIVAGAIRDHQRGDIVGRKSYGKWSVQSIFPVSQESGLRLTTAKFYSPNGHTLGKIGVEPDMVVEREEGPLRVRENTIDSDPDVMKAIDVLRETYLTQR